MRRTACGDPRAGSPALYALLVCVLFAALPVSVQAKGLPGTTALYPPGVAAGSEIDVRARGDFPSWPIQIRVERFGRLVDGLRVFCLEKKGELHVDARGATPGAYTIRLFDASGAVSPCPFRVGTLPETLEIEPNGTPHEFQRLDSADTVVTGRLEKNGDVDVFAFELEEGETLVASVEAHAALGSPMDATLQILSAEGFVLAENDDDAGLDPLLVFRAPSSGLHLIRALAFPAQPNQRVHLHGSSSYVYRLTLTTGPFAVQTAPMAVAAGGGPQSVEVVGWNTKFLPGALEVVEEGDGTYATLTHRRLANTVALPVVPRTSLLEAPTGASGPQRVEVPASLTGRLERKGEKDRFTFHGRKGKAIRFDVFARRWGSPLDVVIRVEAGEGKQLVSNDDGAGRDARVDFTPDADADYVLEVSDLYGRGGERFLYCVQATEIVPDFELQVASDRFLLLVGQPLEIPMTVNRRDGFGEKEEIDLSVGGLPEHVTARVKRDEPEKGPLQWTLVLEAAEAKPFSGPFFVTGKAGALEHHATAGLTGFPPRTASLWLTVREPARKKL